MTPPAIPDTNSLKFCMPALEAHASLVHASFHLLTPEPSLQPCHETQIRKAANFFAGLNLHHLREDLPSSSVFEARLLPARCLRIGCAFLAHAMASQRAASSHIYESKG